MKLTKYAHSCVTLEKDGQRLVIDPGSFGEEYGGNDNVAAIVVTHVHPDHLNEAHLQAITNANPDIPIFTTEEAAKQLTLLHVVTAKAGDEHAAGPFALRFYAGEHATVHPDFPRNQNIGIDVDDGAVYYAGDSFMLPNREINVLLAPASAPWLKAGETMDFINAVHPKIAVPLHDALLSEVGSQSADKWLSAACEESNTRYSRLKPGESIDI